MSGFKGKICIFIVFGCFAASVAHSAAVYTTTLNPTAGTANPDYLRKICKMYGVGGARPDSNGVCSTNNSDYVNPFNLSSSPVNEFPQKYANHVDATDGYETFLGYMPSTVVPRIDNTGNYVGLTNSSGNGAMYAWWGGVTGVTPFTVNYYDGDTLVGTQSCTFGDSTGCDVLSPVGLLTAPTGKYFDGWRCASGTGYNCRANRYLPPDYANLSTPITPYGTSPISNWPNISATRYRDDLRDANGDVVTNMSYEYTGTHVINLYAAWAPYNVTFKCDPRPQSPYVGASTRTQSTYLDANGIIHDIVYGSVIPLDKNFGGASANPLCKSVYYKYDNDNGNDQWCSQYLDSAAGININASTTPGLGEVGGVGGTNYPYTYLGSKNVELYGSCSRYTLYYSCGSFNGETVPGVPPHQRKSLTNNGYISTNSAYGSQNMIIDRRKYPAPAYPYPQTNDGVCETYTLTPTSGANAGVPQEFGNVQIGTATNPGYGCCEKPQYAEFKGYQVRRSNANGEILNNGELIQPGQYGASNCSVSFNNNTNPDTWQPGCDLWPWKGTVYLDAIWEHTPIRVTLDSTGAENTSNLLGFVNLKYGEYFYFFSASTGEELQITQLPEIPRRNGYDFGGYQYCDTNNVCTMVVNSSGQFISGANNLKFTDVDITATVVWVQDYTMQYVCSDGSADYTFGGTAPSATNPVHYGQSVTLAGDPYNDQAGCRKIWGTPGGVDYCDNCFTFGGWTIDAESTAIPNAPVHAANSAVNPWGRTGNTDWCIVDTDPNGLCAAYSANDTFLVTPTYTPKQYDIEYMYATSPSSGASANMPASYTYTIGAGISNADQTPPAHATFNGWCTNLNDQTTCVNAGQAITIGNRDHDARTYYANWECDTGYDLSYNANNEPVCSATVVTCVAGTYLPHGELVCVDCIAGAYCPGGEFTFNENEDHDITVCATNTYSEPAAASCTNCLTANGYENSGNEFADHAYVASCKTLCESGQCVATAGAACTNVGTGGWATGGLVSQGDTLACNVCPTGLVTIGFGLGADEAGDCGRWLHIGNNQLCLRNNRKTERTMNFKIGDSIFYGNMSTDDINMSYGVNHQLKVKVNDVIYSVYDDSALE